MHHRILPFLAVVALLAGCATVGPRPAGHVFTPVVILDHVDLGHGASAAWAAWLDGVSVDPESGESVRTVHVKTHEQLGAVRVVHSLVEQLRMPAASREAVVVSCGGWETAQAYSLAHLGVCTELGRDDAADHDPTRAPGFPNEQVPFSRLELRPRRGLTWGEIAEPRDLRAELVVFRG